MAVIKTGAAYMPLDPNFPPERLHFMCKDASVRLILSEKNLVAEKLPDFIGESFDSSEITSLPEAIYTHEHKAYLFMDIHHIIFDGISSGVFLSDILSALGGASITPETVTAYDYAVYEQEFLTSPKVGEYEAYFDSLLDGVTSAGYPDSAEPDEMSLATNQISPLSSSIVLTLNCTFSYSCNEFISVSSSK